MRRKKSLSRQQLNAQTLLRLLKKNYPDFPLLKEVYREIMEDKMDIENAELFLSWVKEGKIKVVVEHNELPSPFAFNLMRPFTFPSFNFKPSSTLYSLSTTSIIITTSIRYSVVKGE